MTILLCIVDDDIDALPKTQTDMYKPFINMSILHYIQKYNKRTAPFITRQISISSLPCPHNKVYEDLEKFVYKALTVDKKSFYNE